MTTQIKQINLALILMGGNGTRFNNKLPKQYVDFEGVPLFLYTINSFYSVKKINKIFIVIDLRYEEYVKNILIKFNYKLDRFFFIKAGNSRATSLFNGLEIINKIFKNKSVKIISHDAARSFVTSKIINKHINTNINSNQMINTIIPLYDSIIKINNNGDHYIMDRSNIYIVQTPQTFNLHKTFDLLKNDLKNFEKFTDICSYGLSKNMHILDIRGDLSNYKVTDKNDLMLFENIRKKILKIKSTKI